MNRRWHERSRFFRFPGSCRSTYSRLGVFVPGYTRDILISLGLLFASFSLRSLFILYSSCFLPLYPFMLLSSYLSSFFPFSVSVIFIVS